MDSLSTSWTLLVTGGLLAGTLGGLLGIGGGIVVMPLLRFVVGLSPVHAASTCILAVFFTTLGGSYRHHRLGHVRIRSLVPVIIAGGAATAAFSVMFGFLVARERWVDLGVGLVFLLVSARMIAEGIPGFIDRNEQGRAGNVVGGTILQRMGIGIAAGILPGLLGIGTGGILVPAFTFLLRTPVKTAMAASLTCFCFNAFVSSVFKFGQGFIELDVAVPICVGTLVGSNLGAFLNRWFSSRAVKLLFGVLFTLVSLKFILSFIGAET